MDISLVIQCLGYDRPRYLQAMSESCQSGADIEAYIRSLPAQDPFQGVAMKRYHDMSTIPSRMERGGMGWLPWSDVAWAQPIPPNCDPPMGVFFKGNTGLLTQTMIGIVGTRKPSLLARDRVAETVALCTGQVSLSGGALGVDALVHDESLTAGTPTIAVLASGLDEMTPKTNLRLFHRIVDSGLGCIITEYPPGVVPKPYFFPQRNRLIAALSNRLIVVEAAKRSGAVLTANLAAQYGIDVGAFMGGYNAAQSVGCYGLIHDGAFAIATTELLCEFLGVLVPQVVDPTEDTADNTAVDPVLAIISAEPVSMDRLATALQWPMGQVIERVTVLSLQGKVLVLSGQRVVRC